MYTFTTEIINLRFVATWTIHRSDGIHK